MTTNMKVAMPYCITNVVASTLIIHLNSGEEIRLEAGHSAANVPADEIENNKQIKRLKGRSSILVERHRPATEVV